MAFADNLREMLSELQADDHNDLESVQMGSEQSSNVPLLGEELQLPTDNSTQGLGTSESGESVQNGSGQNGNVSVSSGEQLPTAFSIDEAHALYSSNQSATSMFTNPSEWEWAWRDGSLLSSSVESVISDMSLDEEVQAYETEGLMYDDPPGIMAFLGTRALFDMNRKAPFCSGITYGSEDLNTVTKYRGQPNYSVGIVHPSYNTLSSKLRKAVAMSHTSKCPQVVFPRAGNYTSPFRDPYVQTSHMSVHTLFTLRNREISGMSPSINCARQSGCCVQYNNVILQPQDKNQQLINQHRFEGMCCQYCFHTSPLWAPFECLKPINRPQVDNRFIPLDNALSFGAYVEVYGATLNRIEDWKFCSKCKVDLGISLSQMVFWENFVAQNIAHMLGENITTPFWIQTFKNRQLKLYNAQAEIIERCPQVLMVPPDSAYYHSDFANTSIMFSYIDAMTTHDASVGKIIELIGQHLGPAAASAALLNDEFTQLLKEHVEELATPACDSELELQNWILRRHGLQPMRRLCSREELEEKLSKPRIYQQSADGVDSEEEFLSNSSASSTDSTNSTILTKLVQALKKQFLLHQITVNIAACYAIINAIINIIALYKTGVKNWMVTVALCSNVLSIIVSIWTLVDAAITLDMERLVKNLAGVFFEIDEMITVDRETTFTDVEIASALRGEEIHQQSFEGQSDELVKAYGLLSYHLSSADKDPVMLCVNGMSWIIAIGAISCCHIFDINVRDAVTHMSFIKYARELQQGLARDIRDVSTWVREVWTKPKEVKYRLLANRLARCEKLLAISDIDIVCDPASLHEWEELLKSNAEYIALPHKDDGLKSLRSLLSQVHMKMVAKSQAVRDLAVSRGLRPIPFALHLWSPIGGIGKSHWVTNCLVPELHKVVGSAPGSETWIKLSTENKYFPPTGDRSKICVVDEFLTLSEKDPVLGHINSMISEAPYYIDSAFVKNQTFTAEAMVLMSNVSGVSLLGEQLRMNPGAATAMWGRLSQWEIINIDRPVGQPANVREFAKPSGNAGYRFLPGYYIPETKGKDTDTSLPPEVNPEYSPEVLARMSARNACWRARAVDGKFELTAEELTAYVVKQVRNAQEAYLRKAQKRKDALRAVADVISHATVAVWKEGEGLRPESVIKWETLPYQEQELRENNWYAALFTQCKQLQLLNRVDLVAKDIELNNLAVHLSGQYSGLLRKRLETIDFDDLGTSITEMTTILALGIVSEMNVVWNERIYIDINEAWPTAYIGMKDFMKYWQLIDDTRSIRSIASVPVQNNPTVCVSRANSEIPQSNVQILRRTKPFTVKEEIHQHADEQEIETIETIEQLMAENKRLKAQLNRGPALLRPPNRTTPKFAILLQGEPKHGKTYIAGQFAKAFQAASGMEIIYASTAWWSAYNLQVEEQMIAHPHIVVSDDSCFNQHYISCYDNSHPRTIFINTTNEMLRMVNGFRLLWGNRDLSNFYVTCRNALMGSLIPIQEYPEKSLSKLSTLPAGIVRRIGASGFVLHEDAIVDSSYINNYQIEMRNKRPFFYRAGKYTEMVAEAMVVEMWDNYNNHLGKIGEVQMKSVGSLQEVIDTLGSDFKEPDVHVVAPSLQYLHDMLSTKWNVMKHYTNSRQTGPRIFVGKTLLVDPNLAVTDPSNFLVTIREKMTYEQLVYQGIKMYTNIAASSTDPAIRVTVGTVDVYCYRNVVYTNTRHDEIPIEYRFSQFGLKIMTQNLSYNVSYEDVWQVLNNLTPNDKDIPMWVLVYIRSKKQTLTELPQMLPYIQRYRQRECLQVFLKEQSLTFVEKLERIRDSPWWKVIEIAGALGTVALVGTSLYYMLKSTATPTEEKKPEEEQPKQEGPPPKDALWQVIEDKKFIVYHTVDDTVYQIPASAEFTHAEIEWIHKYFPESAWKMFLLSNMENAMEYAGSVVKRHELWEEGDLLTQEELWAPLWRFSPHFLLPENSDFTINLSGIEKQSGPEDTNSGQNRRRAKVQRLKSGFQARRYKHAQPHMVKGTPPCYNKSDLNITQIISAKVQDHVVKVKFTNDLKGTTSTGYGIVMQDRTILAPAHYLPRAHVQHRPDPSSWKYSCMTVVQGVETWYKCRVVGLRRDLELLMLEVLPSEKKWQKFSSLTKYLMTFQQVSAVRRATFMVHTAEGFDKCSCSVNVNLSIQHCGTKERNPLVADDIRCDEYLIATWISASVETAPGFCGLPYIANVPNERCLFGMHIAGSQFHSYGGLLTTEIWNDIIAMPFIPKAEAPEVVSITSDSIIQAREAKHEAYDEQMEFFVHYAEAIKTTVDPGPLWWKLFEQVEPRCRLPKEVMDNPHKPITVFGYIKRFDSAKSVKLKKMKSHFSDLASRMGVPDLQRPSITSVEAANDKLKTPVFWPDGSPAGHSVHWNQVVKSIPDFEVTAPNVDILKRAMEWLFPKWKAFYGCEQHRQLNSFEVLNGIQYGPYRGGTEGMDVTTSVGLPMSAVHGSSLKSAYIEHQNVGNSVIKTWKTTDQTTDLLVHIGQLQDILSYGHVPICPFKGSLKAELVSAPEDKARLFCAGGIDLQVLTTQYYGTFAAAVKKWHAQMECQVGVDPIRTLGNVWNRMLAIDGEFICIDFSRWDKLLPAAVVELVSQAVMEIMLNDYKQVPTMSREHLENTIRGLMKANTVPVMSVQGVVYFNRRGLPSGSFMTTWMNSLCNSLLSAAVVTIWQDQNNLTIIRNSRTFYENWVEANYGDDKVFMVSSALLRHGFNYSTFKEICDSNFGTVTTPPSKESGSMQETVALSGVEFISRSPVQMDGGGRYYNRLKKPAIYGLWHWVARNDDLETNYSQNLSSSLMESLLWGQEEYDKIVALAKASIPIVIGLGLNKLHQDILSIKTFEDARDELDRELKNQPDAFNDPLPLNTLTVSEFCSSPAKNWTPCQLQSSDQQIEINTEINNTRKVLTKPEQNIKQHCKISAKRVHWADPVEVHPSAIRKAKPAKMASNGLGSYYTFTPFQGDVFKTTVYKQLTHVCSSLKAIKKPIVSYCGSTYYQTVCDNGFFTEIAGQRVVSLREGKITYFVLPAAIQLTAGPDLDLKMTNIMDDIVSNINKHHLEDDELEWHVTYAGKRLKSITCHLKSFEKIQQQNNEDNVVTDPEPVKEIVGQEQREYFTRRKFEIRKESSYMIPDPRAPVLKVNPTELGHAYIVMMEYFYRLEVRDAEVFIKKGALLVSRKYIRNGVKYYDCVDLGELLFGNGEEHFQFEYALETDDIVMTRLKQRGRRAVFP